MRRKFPLPKTMPIARSDCEAWLKDRPASNPKSKEKVAISFSGMSTATALLHFANKEPRTENKVCGLNFANGTQVGGGYKTGALAQEEDLCRRLPNLYTSLYDAKRAGLYPFGPSTYISKDQIEKYCDVLFTSDLRVARMSEEYDFALFPPEKQATVSLVTAAAPNVNFKDEVKDLELMYQTVKVIITTPKMVESRTEILVLGAWGCGAYGGDPREMGELFARALKEGAGQGYKQVHFAIPGEAAKKGEDTVEMKPGTDNATVFRQCLKEAGIAFVEMKP